MVEGAPLLREYRLKRLIEGSNPSLSARHDNGASRPVFVWLSMGIDVNPRELR